MKNESELIGSAEAAKLLGIERTTMYQWTSKKLIPFVRVSRNLIKFDREELQSWIAAAANRGHRRQHRPAPGKQVRGQGSSRRGGRQGSGEVQDGEAERPRAQQGAWP